VTKTEYTLGFLFDNNLEKILLIKKNRPKWQKGFLNGIGGKFENNESKVECIHREFKEETNLDINTWDYIGIYEGSSYIVHIFFSTIDKQFLNLFESLTDEKVGIYEVNDILNNNHNILPSAKIAILLILETLNENKINNFKINYK